MWEEQRKLAINLYIQGKKQTLCKLTEVFSVDKSKICEKYNGDSVLMESTDKK